MTTTNDRNAGQGQEETLPVPAWLVHRFLNGEFDRNPEVVRDILRPIAQKAAGRKPDESPHVQG
jgi:hypothetical protein